MAKLPPEVVWTLAVVAGLVVLLVYVYVLYEIPRSRVHRWMQYHKHRQLHQHLPLKMPPDWLPPSVYRLEPYSCTSIYHTTCMGVFGDAVGGRVASWGCTVLDIVDDDTERLLAEYDEK